MICCGIRHHLSCTRHPFADVSPCKKAQDALGWQAIPNNTNPTVSKVDDIIYTAKTCKVQEISSSLRDVNGCDDAHFLSDGSFPMMVTTRFCNRATAFNFAIHCLSKQQHHLECRWFCSEPLSNCSGCVITSRVTVPASTKISPVSASTNGSAMDLVQQAVLDEFLVDLVATNWCQVITTWIETSCNQTTWAFRCFWFHLDEDAVDLFLWGLHLAKQSIGFVDIFSMVLQTIHVPKDIDFIISRESRARTSVVNGILRVRSMRV